jgi:hypothetical protein
MGLLIQALIGGRAVAAPDHPLGIGGEEHLGQKAIGSKPRKVEQSEASPSTTGYTD